MAYDESIDDEIDNLGDTVTLRVVTEGTSNKWGDLNQSSTTDTTTIAIPNILRNEDLEVQEGLFRNGDKRFFFKTTEESLEPKNLISHDSEWFEIKEVLKHRLENQDAAYEVLASKA